MSLAFVLPLFLLAGAAGFFSVRDAAPLSDPSLAAMVGAFSTLPLVAGIVVASEAGPAPERYIGLAAVALGAFAMAGGLVASLRIAADMPDDEI